MNQVAPIYQRVSKMSRPLPAVINALIVDDDEFDRTRLRRIFSEIDLTVKITDTEGIVQMRAALEKQKFDIVFIDYHLNDGTGLDVLEEIRCHPENNNAATIMIAGEGQAGIAVTALQNGCSDYIIKNTLNSESLRRAVINALQKWSLQNSLNSEANMRLAFETILKGLKSECIVEMRPMLSRMLLTVRKNKTMNANSAVAAVPAIMLDLEQSCLRLFSFLDDIENYQPKPQD